MPDIKDTEKVQIQQIAKTFVMQLWKIPFNDGLTVYTKTAQALYAQHHRWKFCLKCGKIDKKENLADDQHSCSLDFKGFPIITETSWYKLKHFFLTNAYSNLLQELGVYNLMKPSTISSKSQDLAVVEAESTEALDNA